jgi:hypothetical protein
LATTRLVVGTNHDSLPACLPARPPACLPACLPARPPARPPVYRYYHDNQIFEEHYEGITAHLEELIKTSHDNEGACDGKSCDSLLSYSGWGDWCPPEGCAACWPGTPKQHNSVLVSSFYYLSQLRIVSTYAGILGKATDEKKYGDLATQVETDFNKHL